MTSANVAQPAIRISIIFLCVWWDWLAIYYELLPYSQTLNSHLCCPQLHRVEEALVFYQYNAEPHIFILIHQKLQKLGWEVLMQPSYSLNLCHQVNTNCSCLR